MLPTWWWPQAFMQPEMLRSSSPMSIQIVEVVEAALDRFRDRDRLGVGERAEVAARTADDVGQETDVRRRESQTPSSSSSTVPAVRAV